MRPRHYTSVGDALLRALAAQLGSGWTPAVESAWRRAYNLVAEIMIAASADVDSRSTASPLLQSEGAKDTAEES